MKRRRRPFDSRRHWHQTQIRLLVGGLALVAVVGGGLVWLIYGHTAAVMAWLCLLGGVSVMGLLWLVLALLELWVKEDAP
jgi:glucose-6-phosphate-specific signal transduction histidine kinase